MKKTIIRLIALVFVVCFAFSLASCFAPKPLIKDLEKAAENLEDEDYDVYYTDDEDEIAYHEFGACIAEYLEADDDDDNSIEIVVFKDTKSAKLYYDELKTRLDYQKEYMELYIESLEHQLKKYEDDLDSDEINEIEDTIKELNKALEKVEDEYVIGRSGKTVWAGTKDAIEDSKG